MFQVDERAPIQAVSAARFREAIFRAQRNGVKLFKDQHGVVLATSGSRPGHSHVVNQAGCTCEGFHFGATCQHHSLLIYSFMFDVPIAE